MIPPRYKRLLVVCAFVVVLAACAVNPAERNNRGNWHTLRGEYDQALPAYQAAQVIEPDNALYYFNAAAAHQGDADLDAAIESLEQAVLRGDDDVTAAAHYNLGNIFFIQQRYANAIAAYQQSLLMNPNSENARYNLELALQFRDLPTPTAIEIQVQPEEQEADDEATPTPNPGAPGQPSPTPTPPPPNAEPAAPDPERSDGSGENASETQQAPQPIEEVLEGELSEEEAARILEPIESEQEGMGNLIRETLTPFMTPQSGRDW